MIRHFEEYPHNILFCNLQDYSVNDSVSEFDCVFVGILGFQNCLVGMFYEHALFTQLSSLVAKHRSVVLILQRNNITVY